MPDLAQPGDCHDWKQGLRRCCNQRFTRRSRRFVGFGIKPEWLADDTAYGSAPNLDWLVNEQKIAPYIPVIDKSKREDGTFSREDFVYDEKKDAYTCPAGKTLTTTGYICTDHGIR